MYWFHYLQQIEKVFKTKELEQQLVDAKLAQANLLMTEEKEKSLMEKQVVSTRNFSLKDSH